MEQVRRNMQAIPRPRYSHRQTKQGGLSVRRVFAVMLFLIGLSLTLYPSVAQYVNSLSSTQLIAEYFDAHTSSQGVAPGDLDAPAASGQTIGEGMFGSITIPKLDLELPIFTGSTDENLSKGIAHLEGTSLPVGGENTHSVLCGHNGVVTNEWFTHIDELTEGDLFYIRTTEQLLTYKVVSSKIISPHDTSELYIKEGQDLITLLTCTQTGEMRLIVTGQRVLTGSWASD